MRLCLFVLLLTATAHAQWDIQNSGTTADLRGIASVGAGIAWASGTNGTVLRTEDGGYLWQRCTIPSGADKLDFRGIQAFDANTAIVMSSGKGDLSRLYKTTDGCQTWKLVITNPDEKGFFDAIVVGREVYGPPSRLWILGDPVNGNYRVFHSTDEALTKFVADETKTLAPPAATSGAFAASNSAFFILPYGPEIPTGLPLPPPQPGSKRTGHYEMTRPPIEYFVTGGAGGAHLYIRGPEWMYDVNIDHPEWKSFAIPLGDGSEASGAFSIGCVDVNTGVVVGGDYMKPNATTRVAAYIDASKKAWLPSTTPPHGYRSAVAYDASNKTWITVGPNGTDISTDDGRNWRALKPTTTEQPDADQRWNALSLPFVVGPHGRIGVLRPADLASTAKK